jgi:membrane-bound lytic murein transglycosylase MltF
MAALQRQLPQPTELRGKIQYSPLSRQQAAALVVDCLIQQPEDLADLAAAVDTKDMALVVQVTLLQHLRLKEIMVGPVTADLHSKVAVAVARAQQEQPVALVPMVASASKVL